MADLALSVASPVIKMVAGKLASGLWEELGLVRSAYSDIEKLQSVLSRINAVLDDAERRSITDRAVSDWLKKLGDAAFDADDVVDEFQTEALRRRIERRGHMITGKVREFFSESNPIAFRYMMARKIREIRERLDEIAEEKSNFYLAEGSSSQIILDRETISSVIESEIYGRNDDKNEVIEFLVDKDNDKNISILPIVGLGGVGKTTLAQSVYNDERIKERFEPRMWVCVDQNFDAKVILRAMIEQVTKEKTSVETLETMSSILKEKLKEKKFLLVIDDLWNEIEREWDTIKILFVCAELGSKIIVTTRSERVASITGTVSPYKLEGLGFDDCWALFKQKAFGLGRQEETPMLVDIGKEIVRKCGGLPLAAKILGSLMGSKTGEAAWLAVRDSEISRLPKDEVGILAILKLSYDHLPAHLKRCFTYCSMFPKDHNFEIKRLIQLWMAEGLIDTSRTSLNAEDIGNQYFNHLLSRSFFQDVEMDWHNINPETCKMHDLVHDLACSITKDEALLIEGDTKRISDECRYLSLTYAYWSSIDLKAICEAKKLRSLILLGKENNSIVDAEEFIFNATKNFTRLRALDLCSSQIEKLSDRVSRLKHLRFLDLSCTNITTLPFSITRLYNLQTLNLERCTKLKELPEGIGNLCKLRYIDISRCAEVTTLPTSITRLSSLQTLDLQYCSQLKELPEGMGNLCNLRYMDISGCAKVTTLPTSITRLSNLQTLNLQYCKMLKELPEGMGNLCNLRYMDISGCDEVTTLPTSITRLSSLQTLNLYDCYQLKELPEGIGNLGNLRCLNITGFNKMPRGLGRLGNLETLPLFIVAPENGRTIVELQHLNSIRGSLVIKNLHHVKDPDEAMQANLRVKTRLNDLTLEWNRDLDEEQYEPSSTEVQVAEGVLERLQPHHNLEKLSISYYMGIRLPNWMSSSLPNLVELKMWDLKWCEHLPLGQWPSLKYLSLQKMHAMRRIGEEFHGDGDAITFPSLEDLTLSDMPNLEKWHTESTTTGRKMASFPRLSRLLIESCPKLAVQPCIPCSVEKFKISRNNEMLLSAGSLAGLSKLKSLCISRCGISSSSSSGWWDGLQYLTALEKLEIEDCDELTCLPKDIMYLPSLQTLYLLRNRNLKSLEGRGIRKQQQFTPFFTALRHLNIKGADMLTALPEWVGGFTALQELIIRDCPQLALLPNNLQHLTALQKLQIFNLPQLAMLPDGLRHLTALLELQISKLPQLAMLPDGLRHLTSLLELRISKLPQLAMLSDGLQHLAALQVLSVRDCPQLAMLPDGLQRLATLRKLEISDLPQLAMLPDGLRHLTALQQLCISRLPQLAMLPDGLQYLAALRWLSIQDCPQLARRCRREIGEDWHKIAHIPSILICPSVQQREEEDRREEEEDGEETSTRCCNNNFAMKFLRQFGFASCTSHN